MFQRLTAGEGQACPKECIPVLVVAAVGLVLAAVVVVAAVVVQIVIVVVVAVAVAQIQMLILSNSRPMSNCLTAWTALE